MNNNERLKDEDGLTEQSRLNPAQENIQTAIPFQDTLKLLLILKREFHEGAWFEAWNIPFSKTSITFKSPADRANYINYLVRNKMLITKQDEFQRKPVTKYQVNEKLRISEGRIKTMEKMLQVLPAGVDGKKIIDYMISHLGLED